MFSAFLKPALSGLKVVNTNARAEKPQPQFVQFVCIYPVYPESELMNNHVARSAIYRGIHTVRVAIDGGSPQKVVKMSTMTV